MSTDYKTAIAKVKSAYDIVEYIGSLGVPLKPNGIGRWKTNCVFHKENTPSMIVNESFQNYRCFGCGANGDILTFVTTYENLSFNEALSKLAEDKNIELNLTKNETSVDYDSLKKILKLSADFYCDKFDKLNDEHVAKKEILDRGLTYDNSDSNGLRYGYSPSGNQLYKHLKKAGFSDELIVESGVCRKNSKTGAVFDFFRSRLMFILTDRYNRPVGFSSRKLFEDDNRGKYVNSSDSILFKKSQVLYNHFLARRNANKAKEIFICEGQFDVAAFIEAGLPNAVASSGTAFTKEQVTECKKLVSNDGRLVFCFDGDTAGIDAAKKAFLSFPEIHESAFVVIFPEGDDPCDYRLEHGNEKLVELVKNPITMIDFMIEETSKKYDIETPLGRMKFIEEAASIIKTINNVFLREEYLRLLSVKSLTPIDQIKEVFGKAEPLTFDTSKTVNVDEEEEEEDLRGKEDNKEFEEIKKLIEKEPFYRLAARFVSLGLTRPTWRSSVIRSYNLLPKSFYPFLKDLKKLEGEKVIFPEMFETSFDLSSYLMNQEFSDFYKFMDLEELKDHFIYLHDTLNKYVFKKRSLRNAKKILTLLEKDQDNSLEYFKAIMQKVNKD